jgi:TPR repeat protein/serine/threonine protein kinase
MDTIQPHTQALPPGTRIEEFVIDRVLGSGGFGITYLATDAALNRKVVIKENLPAQFCFRDTSSLTVAPRHTHGDDVDNFQWSLENFSKEASMLASLDHAGIVKVLRSFHACGTAYFVMPFVEGMPFDELIKNRQSKGQVFTEEELRGLLERVLDALAYLHDRGIYHRDIKPGNILITNEGIPVLIDFGSAREQLCERSMTVIESPGYTPFEQLQSRGNVGPWSDLYALGATLVKAITFEGIPKAADRVLDDPWEGLANHMDASQRYSFDFLYSIDRSLEPMPSTRWQQAKEWRDELNGRSSDAGQPVQIQSKKTPPPLPEVNVPSGHANSLEQTKQKPELWNPTTAVNLSALFSPAFGAYLHAKNAKELGLVSEHKVNIRWFYPLAITQLLSVYLMDGKVSGFFILNTMALIAWYFSSAKKQINLVKKIHSNNYTRKSFFEPIFVLLACWFLATGVYLLSFSYGFNNSNSNNEEISNTSASDSSHTTSEKTEKNEAIDYFNRGIAYQNGEGVPKDETEAVKWYRKAAELGLAGAQNNLGVCYQEGQGIAKDEAEAVNWYRKAAEQGLDLAQNNLAICYDGGHGVAKDESEAVKWYRKASDQNYASAHYNLGIRYLNGMGVSKDVLEGVKLLRKATAQNFKEAGPFLAAELHPETWIYMAEDGDPLAQALFGDALYWGGQINNGIKEDQAEGVKWITKSSLAGHPLGKYLMGLLFEQGGKFINKDKNSANREYAEAIRLGLIRDAENGGPVWWVAVGQTFENGRIVEKDPAEAITWYTKAANKGYIDGIDSLAGCFMNGIGVNKDLTKAARLFQEAAELGSSEAQWRVGNFYDNGVGVAKNEFEAARWYRKSAEQGNPYGQYYLGLCYDDGKGVTKDEVEAFRWFRKSAVQDNPDAQWYLGIYYSNGKGIAKNEYEAVKWFRKAAEYGDPIAQYSLATCYDQGIGIAQDKSIAVKWYRKSAEQGDSAAQRALGICYSNGEGVDKDIVESARWYRKSAEQGDQTAQNNLGIIYANGDGVSRDLVKAYMWIGLAAASGSEQAKENLALIAKEMTQAQLAEARRLGREWKPINGQDKDPFAE